MFDHLIIDSKRQIKVLRSIKIEKFEVIIVDLRINFHRKTSIIVAGDFPNCKK